MKGLLIKDFKLIMTRGIFILFVIVCYIFFQFGAGNSQTSVGLVTLMLSLFSITSITYDEYENGMPFLFTLPITRKQYVQEKYAFGFLLTTVTWVVMNVICFVFDSLVWAGAAENLWDNIIFNVTYLLVVYFMMALEIALKLKFKENTGLAMMVIMAIMGAIALALYTGFEVSANLKAILLSVKTLIVIAIVFVGLIYAFYRWAVRIMEKREF